MKAILPFFFTFIVVTLATDLNWLLQGRCGNSTGPREFKHQQDTPSLNFFNPEGYQSYIATGKHRTINVIPRETSPSEEVSAFLAWDYENKRIRFFHTNNDHYVYQNNSYFVVPPFGLCFSRSNYNYSYWVQNWSELSEFNVGADVNLLPPSVDVERIYSGDVHDQHACPNNRIQVSLIENILGAVSKLHWTAPLKVRPEIPGLGGLNLLITQTTWFNKVEKVCPSNNLYDVPLLCQSAIPFESFFDC